METCVCAAIRNRVTGQILTARRHHEALGWAVRVGLGPSPQIDQGFLTTFNRFVDRATALALQQAAGIASVAEGGYRPPNLYSEDLS